jgi:anti-sigma factor RsiW
MTGARRFALSSPDWGQAHLSLDAIVAYVDEELAPGANARADAHLTCCRECSAEVVAQLQARVALRAAAGPCLPSRLLRSLRAIPVDAELPPAPPGLAVSAEGQFVLLRDVPPAHAAAGTAAVPAVGSRRGPSTAPRRFSRRARIGALSGLALGALAVGALAAPGPAGPPPVPQRGVLGGAVLDIPAQARLSTSPSATPAADSLSSTPPSASASPLDPAVLDARVRESFDRLPAAFRPDGNP